MAYTKTEWVNGATALSQDNMNHIEQGIYDAHEDIETLNTNTFGTKVTIPRTLSSNDKLASFDYEFPADGYLMVKYSADGSLPPLMSFTLKINNTLSLYDMVAFGFMTTDRMSPNSVSPTEIHHAHQIGYGGGFLFVKKGMTLSGEIYCGAASYTAKFITEFYPLG